MFPYAESTGPGKTLHATFLDGVDDVKGPWGMEFGNSVFFRSDGTNALVDFILMHPGTDGVVRIWYCDAKSGKTSASSKINVKKVDMMHESLCKKLQPQGLTVADKPEAICIVQQKRQQRRKKCARGITYINEDNFKLHPFTTILFWDFEPLSVDAVAGSESHEEPRNKKRKISQTHKTQTQ